MTQNKQGQELLTGPTESFSPAHNFFDKATDLVRKWLTQIFNLRKIYDTNHRGEMKWRPWRPGGWERAAGEGICQGAFIHTIKYM